MKDLLKKLLFFIFWTILVFIVATLPVQSNEIESGISIYDKIAHFILFGIFNLALVLFCESYLNYKKIKILNKKIYIFSFLFSFLYIILSEYIQNFIPGRNVSFWDSLSGILGVLFFSYIKIKK